jgi:hypothetical protein
VITPKNLFALTLLAVSLQAGYAMSPEFKDLLKQREARGQTATVLCDFDFEGRSFEKLQPKWIVYKGSYQVVDGLLQGEELSDDKHVATAGMDLPIGQHGMAYFEVELHKATNVIVTLNGKGRGHVCRAVITRNFIRVQSDNKTGPVHETRKLKVKSDQTLKILIELHNDTLSLSLLDAGDSKPLVLKNDFIAHPIDNIRWAVAKGPAKLDHICVASLSPLETTKR